MTYLLIANLFWTAVLTAIALAGLVAWRRRQRRKDKLNLAPEDPSADYAPRRDWSKSRGKLNYSSFVFLDANRDGIYSVGDRPMGGIMVRLTKGGRYVRSARTNSNGFANFETSVKSRSVPIRDPGGYAFAVSVPPGWVTTTGNAVQERAFKLLPGSPSGIVADEMVKPVGLAPIRFVSGATTSVPVTLRLLRGESELLQRRLDAGQPFRIEVPDKADRLVVEGEGIGRMLMLSSYPTHLGLIEPRRAPIDADAKLETIDFDDVNPRDLRKVPCGYAGLNWFNLNAMSRDFGGNHHGYVNGNTSGDHILYTSSGHPSEFWADKPFGFHSVMLTCAWLGSEGEIATIQSWRGEDLFAQDEVVLTALTPIHYAPMLSGITRVRFTTAHFWQMVVEDLVLAR